MYRDRPVPVIALVERSSAPVASAPPLSEDESAAAAPAPVASAAGWDALVPDHLRTKPQRLGPKGARLVDRGSPPLGAEVGPGERFRQSWRVRNDTDRAWPADTRLVCVTGDPAIQPDPAGTVIIAEHGGVAPGAECVISIDLVAPEREGRYECFFRLLAESLGGRFGQRLPVCVVVGSASASGTSDGHEDEGVRAEVVERLRRNGILPRNGSADGEVEVRNRAVTSARLAALRPILAGGIRVPRIVRTFRQLDGNFDSCVAALQSAIEERHATKSAARRRGAAVAGTSDSEEGAAADTVNTGIIPEGHRRSKATTKPSRRGEESASASSSMAAVGIEGDPRAGFPKKTSMMMMMDPAGITSITECQSMLRTAMALAKDLREQWRCIEREAYEAERAHRDQQHTVRLLRDRLWQLRDEDADRRHAAHTKEDKDKGEARHRKAT